MAFVSEIKYVGRGEAEGNEFLEITLSPNDDLSAIVLSFYNSNGTLSPSVSSFFPNKAEVTMQDIVDLAGGTNNTVPSSIGGVPLSVNPHPDNPDWLVITVPASLSDPTHDPSGSNPGSAEAIALTDTKSGEVISAYDIGSGTTSQTFTEGVAVGTKPTTTINTNSSSSIQWTIDGNSFAGAPNSGNSTICLCTGALVDTLAGEVYVEDLEPGMHVKVLGGGYRPLKAVHRRHISPAMCAENPKIRPVRIAEGAMGLGLPTRPLMVSPHHRMLIASPVVKRMFDVSEVLVEARFLTKFKGISQISPKRGFDYFHLVMDRHEVVFANGAPTETLLLAKEAVKMSDEEHVQVLDGVLPIDLAHGKGQRPARMIPKTKQQKKLAERMRKNDRDLLEERQKGSILETTPILKAGKPSGATTPNI